MDSVVPEPTFTQLIFKNAWANTKRFFRSVRHDIIGGGLAACAGFTVFYFLQGLPVAVEGFITAAAFTFGPIAAAVILVFFWNLLISPSELAYEAIRKHQNQTIAIEAQPHNDPPPVNWNTWKQMDEWSIDQFAAILARVEPTTLRTTPDSRAYRKLISDDVEAKKLPYVKEYDYGIYDGRQYEKEVDGKTRIKKSEAIKWADAHEGFDTGHVR
jgi:hypothetical protein